MKFTLLKKVQSLQEAQIIRSYLESEGITVRIPDEHTLGITGYPSFSFGGVRILVLESELETAKQTLSDKTPLLTLVEEE